jgi:hypothetical protein
MGSCEGVLRKPHLPPNIKRMLELFPDKIKNRESSTACPSFVIDLLFC